MSEFNFGDKVRAKHDIENMIGTVKKGSIGTTVLSDPRHKEWAKIFFGKELYTFDFDGITVHTDSIDVEKITEEPEVEKKKEAKFKVGDEVQVKDSYDLSKDGIRENIKGLCGKVLGTFPLKGNWCIEFTNVIYVIHEDGLELVESTKPENLRKFEIHIKGFLAPLKFTGTFDSGDAEFDYYVTPEGKEYEIRQELITLIISEKA